MPGVAKELKLQTNFELCFHFSTLNRFKIYERAEQSW